MDGRTGRVAHTDAHGVGFVDLVTVITGAHEAAECVGTASVLAHAVHFVALIDVFQNHLIEKRRN